MTDETPAERQDPETDEVLARMMASPARRIFGLVVLGGLGVLLIRMSLFGASGWIDLLVGAMGVAALAVGWALFKATARCVELRESGLYDTDGTCLAAMEDIQRVDRGVFAFKPSNGFLMRTYSSQSLIWRPGLYWRLGRRLGVGGITRASEGKQMADIISILLADKEANT